MPGLRFEIVRSERLTVRGLDLDGNEVVLEGDELLARMFLHEIDHLDGVLLLDRLDRASASRRSVSIREQGIRGADPEAPAVGRRPAGSADAHRLLRHARRSVPPLRALVAAGHDIALVVTQPDRRRSGSGSDPSPGEGGRHRASARRVRREGAGGHRRGRGVGAEAGVVVAFGQLLPVALLEALPLGFVNVHFSLLPRWRRRGARGTGHPRRRRRDRRVRHGARSRPRYRTGVRLRRADRADETAGELTDGLVDVGTDLLLATLPDLRPRCRSRRRVSRRTPTSSRSEEFELDSARPAEARARRAGR